MTWDCWPRFWCVQTTIWQREQQCLLLSFRFTKTTRPSMALLRESNHSSHISSAYAWPKFQASSMLPSSWTAPLVHAPSCNGEQSQHSSVTHTAHEIGLCCILWIHHLSSCMPHPTGLVPQAAGWQLYIYIYFLDICIYTKTPLSACMKRCGSLLISCCFSRARRHEVVLQPHKSGACSVT